MSLLTSAICEQRFGQPTPEMERKWMGLFTTGSGPVLPIHAVPARIYCNIALIDPLRDTLETIHERGLGSQIKTWDGCFNIRSKKGGQTPSLHSWGLAVDLNAAWNRYGAKPTLSPEVIACFTEEGFDWGGGWKTPDGMHFQLSVKRLEQELAQLHAR